MEFMFPKWITLMSLKSSKKESMGTQSVFLGLLYVDRDMMTDDEMSVPDQSPAQSPGNIRRFLGQQNNSRPASAAVSDSSHLQLDEQIAYRPFDDINVLVTRYAHLATFLHYLFHNCFVQQEMMFYLATEWFRLAPSKDQAIVITEKYLSRNSVAHLDCITSDVVIEIEAQLATEKVIEIAKLKALFDKARAKVKPILVDTLKQFQDLVVNLGLGSLYKTSLLVDLPHAEEPAVIDEIIRPHVQTLLQSDSSDDAINELLAEGLTEFMRRGGVRMSKSSPPKRIMSAPTPTTTSSSSTVTSSATITAPTFNASKPTTPTKESTKETTIQRDSGSVKSGKKIRDINGHRFMTHSYSHLTLCGVCNTLLPGASKQGWTCLECNFTIHKANDTTGDHLCYEKVEACLGSKPVKRSFFARKPTSKTSMKDHHSASKLPSIEISRTGDESCSSATGSDLSRSGSFAEESRDDFRHRTHSTSSAVRSASTVEKYQLRIPELPEETLSLENKLWSETVPPSVLSSLDKQEIKRQELIYELIQTERAFQRQLVIFDKVFRQPIIDYAILSGKDIDNLFCNIDDVIVASTPLYDAMTKHRSEFLGRPVNVIADSFLSGSKHINSSVYAKYCANMKFAGSLFSERLKSNAAFSAIMKEIHSQNVCERLTFVDFLAKPLQRLTKYPLILKAILKATKQADEVKKLEIAISNSENLLKLVQEAVTASEDIARLRMINEMLDRNNIAPLEEFLVKDLLAEQRHFIHEGAMMLRTGDKTHDIHVILLSDMILLTQVKEDSKLALKVPGRDNKGKSPVIHLGSSLVRPVATDPKALFIISRLDPSTPTLYEIVSESRSVIKDWQEKIAAAAKSFQSANPGFKLNRMKELTIQQNDDDDDDVDPNPMVILEHMISHCESAHGLLLQIKHNIRIADPLASPSSTTTTTITSPSSDRLGRHGALRQTLRAKPSSTKSHGNEEEQKDRGHSQASTPTTTSTTTTRSLPHSSTASPSGSTIAVNLISAQHIEGLDGISRGDLVAESAELISRISMIEADNAQLNRLLLELAAKKQNIPAGNVKRSLSAGATNSVQGEASNADMTDRPPSAPAPAPAPCTPEGHESSI